MRAKNHWEKIYSTRSPEETSWFQQRALVSLKLMADASVPVSASIIDVGGGASRLVDDLLARGYDHVTVLDLSPTALAAAKARLGGSARRVRWLEANVLEADLPERAYDVWHDRAVFHFLTQADERTAYVSAVLRAVKPGGIVMVATFAEDGPERCSGLPVMRYSPSALHAEFGAAFDLVAHERETHRTPSGAEQKFVYCVCRRREEAR